MSTQSDAQKVRDTLHRYPAGLSIEELMERVPEVPRATIDTTLKRMVRDGEAICVTRGFYRVDPTFEGGGDNN